MSCSYYEFRQNDYYCHRKSDYVNSDVYYKYCRSYNYNDCPIYKDFENLDSRCFISSACISAQGLPDDCTELTALRWFRDNWLIKQPNGEKEISEYYRRAPLIVRNINDKASSEEIYDSIYRNMVKPCVSYIQDGEYEKAYSLYKSYTYIIVQELEGE